MASKFLDKTGVSTLWNKTKELIATKADKKIATTSVAGLVKPSSVITKPTLNSITSTSGKYYQVQMSSDGNLFVNVPWSSSTSSASYSPWIFEDCPTLYLEENMVLDVPSNVNEVLIRAVETTKNLSTNYSCLFLGNTNTYQFCLHFDHIGAKAGDGYAGGTILLQRTTDKKFVINYSGHFINRNYSYPKSLDLSATNSLDITVSNDAENDVEVELEVFYR